MARYAAVLTTDAWDPFVAAQYAHAAGRVGAGDMFVVANTTRGPVAVPDPVRSLAVDEDAVRQLGLQIAYEETLFCYNVDYLYIAFGRAHPDYDYYVFFDYPTRVDTDVDALIEDARRDGVDFIAEPVRGRIEDWVYAAAHRAIYPPGILQGTMLPFAVLSRSALLYLAERRLQLSRDFEQRRSHWPFCEAFVPSELMLAGFKFAPLSTYGSVEAFDWWPPILDTTLPAARRPGFIHPVLDRSRLVTATLRHTSTRDLFRYRTAATLLRHVTPAEYLRPFLSEAGLKARRAVRNRLPPAWRKPAPARWSGAEDETSSQTR